MPPSLRAQPRLSAAHRGGPPRPWVSGVLTGAPSHTARGGDRPSPVPPGGRADTKWCEGPVKTHRVALARGQVPPSSKDSHIRQDTPAGPEVPPRSLRRRPGLSLGEVNSSYPSLPFDTREGPAGGRGPPFTPHHLCRCLRSNVQTPSRACRPAHGPRQQRLPHPACLRGVCSCSSRLSCAGHRSRDGRDIVQRTFAPSVALPLASSSIAVRAVQGVVGLPTGLS